MQQSIQGCPPLYTKLEYNSRVSHMGMRRQFLVNPNEVFKCGDSSKCHELDRRKLDVPECYFADHCQVSNWARAVGMPQYAPVFCYYLINGRQLLTLDALALQRLGINDTASNLHMEKLIKHMSRQARNQSREYNVLPYFYTHYLNRGMPPPSRHFRELFQFTDPYLNENQKFVNISANDLFTNVKDPHPPEHYSNSRTAMPGKITP